MEGRVAFLQHSEDDVPGLLGVRARELGLAPRCYRADHGVSALPRPGSFDLLVVMGSDASVTDPSVPWIEPERRLVAGAVTDGVAVLGVCFGAQLLAQVLGGQVQRARHREIGWRRVHSTDPRRVPPGPWLQWHEDGMTAPPGSEVVARTAVSLQAFVLDIHTGVQFHPEVSAATVRRWVDQAGPAGRLEPEEAEELLAGFDPRGHGPDEQARRLFDGYLARAGLGPRR